MEPEWNHRDKGGELKDMNRKEVKELRIEKHVDEAVEIGYLRLGVGNPMPEDNYYLFRCRQLKIPMVTLRIGRRWAKVVIDLAPANRRLTDEAFRQGVGAFLEKQLGRGKVWSQGGMETWRVEKIPPDLGPALAIQLRNYMMANSDGDHP